MRFQLFPWLLLLVFSLHSLLFGDNHGTWVQGLCLHDQRLLLLQLKHNLSFLSSATSRLHSWSSNNRDCCSDWDGVTCNEVGEVIGLDLTDQSITASSDGMRSLFQFRHLEKLSLSNNNFDSIPIPPGLDSLTNLTYLNLSGSGFAGQVPNEISRLTRLVFLDLSTTPFAGSNSLKLEKPDLGDLVRNLSQLRELRLDGVNVSKKGKEWCEALSSAVPNLQVLSMSNCRLSGPLDSSLSKLQSLSEISLAQNDFTAEIPEFFGNFSNLTSLELTYCGLNGYFPQRIFQLPKLKILDISANPLLQGSLPEFSHDSSFEVLILYGTNFSGQLPDSIGNLKVLSKLDSFQCGFDGPIPPSMTNLDELTYLDLSHNRLSGRVPPLNPDSLGKLVNLNLRNNSLNGSMPSSLFTLPSLQKLDLSHNRFTGQLGEFTFESSSSMLDVLDLGSNKFEGPIPSSIFKISSLKMIVLSSNQFSGSLPLNRFQTFGNLSNLDLSGNLLSVSTSGINSALFSQVHTLKLGSCNLRVLPNFLRNQSKLIYLDLSNNKIGGKIPNWIEKIGNGSVTYLNLSQNLLESPEIPFSKDSFKWLGVLDLHSNLLQGPIPILPPFVLFLDYSKNHLNSVIPSSLGSYLQEAIFLSLSTNNLYGEIPESLCNASYLQVLDLSNNSFSGSIPTCLGGMEALRVLNLRRNHLSGTMNRTFRKGCVLRTIDLNGNRLEGQVSRTLGYCTMLEVIDLGNNQLSGSFPCWLGNLIQLRVLVLRNNLFRGTIRLPEAKNTFPMLQIFDLSANDFAGKVPAQWFLTMKSMRINEGEESISKHQILRFGFLELNQLYYQDSVTIRSKGLEMELVKILTAFTSIDLSDNAFEGIIPEELGDLKALYVLNLSNNALSGPIPSSLGNLKQLESLDLSRNKLGGMIPSELASLTFLSVLNLSFNKLVGRIPSGSQLRTFTEDSFKGNDGLCGPPLSNNCQDSSTSDVAIPDPRTFTEASVNGADGLCETFRFLFGECTERNEFKGQLIVTALGFGVGNGIACYLALVVLHGSRKPRSGRRNLIRL